MKHEQPHWLDMSFAEKPAVVSRRAHLCGLTTQIVNKVPAWDLVVMRIEGTPADLRRFLQLRFKEPEFVEMHMNAVKTGAAPILGAIKNRALRENRD
jgi:glutaredoxin-related protein